MKKITLSLFLITVLFTSVSAQSLDDKKLNRYFDALESADKVMASVGLSVAGEPVFQRTVGFMDVENQIPANPQTKYRVGSISKMFTSVLTLQAIEAGLLDLDTKLDVFFPEVQNAGEISIKHLLQHRSGIFSLTSSPDYLSWNTETKSKPELLAIIIAEGSIFEPDSKGDYSNSNYVLLTWIVEAVFEKNYQDLLREKITGPLKLNNTYLGERIGTFDDEAHSYQMKSTWTKSTETDMSIPLGAGAMVSNTEDLGIFIHALFEGKLISQESLGQMMEMKDNMGLGMFVFPFYDKKSFGHGGGIDEFRSLLSYFPEEKLAFVLLSNGSDMNNNDIALATLSAYFGKDYEIPAFSQEKLSEDVLEKLTGVYGADSFPLKITVTKEGSRLFAQATGQPSFPLTYDEGFVFSYAQAGLKMEFDPENEKMNLKQGGMSFDLEKKQPIE
ncbi:MAG: class A beta-lactamase-related serine hydrolase [Mongoliibacter sp.]|uniref:serine hydrolase domain-containing protein n=1 Tax=Mongoliibacter sp. TaxID=2022438 RepID=UPI0012F209C2|nr:serine hydrolase domain-containing protein [Mongoliibacter sp.]TVP53708.1 MAG: class A beta-lactamase-related serine hydrolase [Mongoliibacter sp.]